jgi:TolB-like protein/Tfp pilus assembly protein PilF
VEKGSAYPKGPPERPAEERLDSWKEIAAYLGREVRTVQRWEKTEGLPVHRLQHDKLGSLYAFRSELDAWRKEREPALKQEAEEVEAKEKTAAEKVPDPPIADTPPVLSRSIPKSISLPLTIAFSVALILVVAYFLRPPKKENPQGKIKLVVLPFRNMSNDPAQDFFSEGLTEEMITQLGRLNPGRLGVIASTTAQQYKNTSKSADEIGSELDVSFVLEGSVRRGTGNEVAISAQLIRVSDQTHVWAQTYVRNVSDIIALQNDVSHAIAQQIQVALTPEQETLLGHAPTVVPDAYESYLRGISYSNKRTPEALQKSAEYFGKAIQKNPQYALAYAGLAESYALLGSVPNDTLPPQQAMKEAKAAAAKALQIDDSLAEGHAVLGLILQSYDWDWPGAEREYKRALEINPACAPARHWYSLLLKALGRNDEALKQIKSAEELDPLSPVIHSALAQMYYFHRQYDQAIDECTHALSTLEADPNFVLLHYHLGRAYGEKGMYPQAISELEKARSLSGNHPAMLMGLGNMYGAAGRRAEAMQILQQFEGMAKTRYVPAVYFAGVYTGLGEKDKAFQWLHTAYQQRTDYLIYLNVEPMADPLRSDPRFKDLLRRIGLPQ